jgi:hypothetical protein
VLPWHSGGWPLAPQGRIISTQALAWLSCVFDAMTPCLHFAVWLASCAAGWPARVVLQRLLWAWMPPTTNHAPSNQRSQIDCRVCRRGNYHWGSSHEPFFHMHDVHPISRLQIGCDQWCTEFSDVSMRHMVIILASLTGIRVSSSTRSATRFLISALWAFFHPCQMPPLAILAPQLKWEEYEVYR